MKHIFLLLIGLTCFQAYSQKAKIISASETRWSGGIAGRMGSSYTIMLQFSAPINKIKLDTLWIDQHYIPLNDQTNKSIHIKSYTKGKGCVFEISAGIDRSYSNWSNTTELYANKNPKPTIMFPSFKGDALLTFYYKNKKRNIVIPQFYNMPPVNYP